MTPTQMAQLLEKVVGKRESEILGRDYLESMERLGSELRKESGIVDWEPRPRTWPAIKWPTTAKALRDRGFDSAAIAERQLAGAVGDLGGLIGAVLFDDQLRPAGLLEWSPRTGWQRTYGCGLLLDVEAVRLLAKPLDSDVGAPEFWIVGDFEDFLTLGTYWSEIAEQARGVIGVVGAGWTSAFADRFPTSSSVIVMAGPHERRVLESIGKRSSIGRLSLLRWASRGAA